MRAVIIICLFVVCLIPLSSKGQDIHFSQPEANPYLFNPGYTGFFTGDFRAGMIYRNQWATVINPYQTYGLTAELIILKRRYSKDGVGIGISFLGDVAGTSRYGTNQGDVTVSYFKSLDKYSTHFLSLGVRAGFGQKGFRQGDLAFSQNGSGIQEYFEKTTEKYPDLSVGIIWQLRSSEELIFKAGVAAFHLTQPELTYINDNSSKLWMRYLGHFRVDIKTGMDYAIIPSIVYQRQNNFQEIVYGGDFKWFIDESPYHFFTLSAGLYFRQMDAFILGLKSEYKTWLFCLSYDANISSLWKSSYTVGSLELSVLYTFQKNKSIRRKEVPCPVF